MLKPVHVFTTPEVWNRHGYLLRLPDPEVHYVHSMDLAHLESRFGDLQAEVVYGMGGGQAVDTAKWVGGRAGARVVAVPTVLSTDAALVPSVAVRVEGRVRYVGDRAPDELVILEEAILAAPPRYNAAGWGDVLSIYTAVWDWRLGSTRTGEPFDREVAEEALALLEEACLPDTRGGLRTLLAALKAEVRLCQQVGSSRPEEGSEHLFAYVLEPRLPADRKYLHGELVGLGLSVMSRIQGQDQEHITSLMDRAGLRWRPEELGIPKALIRQVLQAMPAEAEIYKFPYCIAHEMQVR